MSKRESNYHYVAAKADIYGLKVIVGHIYSRSRKRAQAWLDENLPDHRALSFNACSPAEKRGEYPVLSGESGDSIARNHNKHNLDGDGIPIASTRRKNFRLSKQVADYLEKFPNQSAEVERLVIQEMKNELLH